MWLNIISEQTEHMDLLRARWQPVDKKTDKDKHFSRKVINTGPGWIRTNVDSRRRIYSPSPLATRAPTLKPCII